MIRFDQNLVTDVALVKEYPVDRTFTHPLPQAKLLTAGSPQPTQSMPRLCGSTAACLTSYALPRLLSRCHRVLQDCAPLDAEGL